MLELIEKGSANRTGRGLCMCDCEMIDWYFMVESVNGKDLMRHSPQRDVSFFITQMYIEQGTMSVPWWDWMVLLLSVFCLSSMFFFFTLRSYMYLCMFTWARGNVLKNNNYTIKEKGSVKKVVGWMRRWENQDDGMVVPPTPHSCIVSSLPILSYNPSFWSLHILWGQLERID